MRYKILALVALLAAPVAAQTINPNQIRPGAQNNQWLATVTANNPPDWVSFPVLTAAASGGAPPGTAFNGSGNVTFDYHSFGAAPLASPAFTGNITQNATRSGVYNLMQSGAVSGLLSGDNVYSQLGDTAAYVNDDFQWGFNYTADGSSSNYGWFGLPGDPYCTISTAGLLSCPAFSATTSMTTPVEFFVYNGSEVSSIQATSATNTQYTGTGTNTFAGSISAGGSIVSGAGIGPSPSALWTYGTAAPSGSCNSGSLYSNTAGSSGSTFYVCVSGAWTAQPLPDFIVSISSGTQNAHSCSTPGSVNIPEVTTTMALLPGYASDPASLVGWGASGGMVFHIWPSAANTVQYEVCNQTAANITYSAISFNVAAR